MGKHLLLTVTVFFFILALSHARTPLDLPENEVVVSDLATDLPESDPKTTSTAIRTIILPSEKPETESETEAAVDIESEKTQPGKAELETNEFQPLTVVNFRPVNRQFPQRPSLTLRHRRPCRQHRFGKPWGPSRFPHREIPYGNDMMMSSSWVEEKEVREIPARWVKFHHRDTSGPKFPYWRDEGVARGEEFKRLRHFHRHHHHRHHMEGEQEKEEREGHEHERGFMVKIRKFLNHF